MRVLCLHGHGTSSTIFETQLTAICEALDESMENEYIFIDGPVESDRVRGSYLLLSSGIHSQLIFGLAEAGMSEMVPGPFFGWFTGFTPNEIQASHDLVAEVIAEDGPFDAIFGFSQGATLALCYLLQHSEPPPVHFAVLFSCAGPAFSSDMSLSCEIIRGFVSDDFDTLQYLATDMESSGPDPSVPLSIGSDISPREAFMETISSALRLGGDNGFIAPAAAVEQWRAASVADREELMTRVFHPSLTSTRVKIPTVHVLGQSDTAEVFAQAALCRNLCDARLVEQVEHSAAHDVPRKSEEVQQVVQAILAAKSEAELMGF
ncbi:uncharacterized protein N7496_010894 [Penicillium cataractarum]|uniref:Serine hydrolase domain-containing protein n=1 Tax=Penicillium cataractarum TaxID=2100454 RepID=A0A9W9UXI9_9EURO|nr:uncharacterized protein N7496_010894 [Penicillium cataractarum]KAJ5358481.1 hypothetical protein N7496_010894 [Penicillium cataractarum]